MGGSLNIYLAQNGIWKVLPGHMPAFQSIFFAFIPFKRASCCIPLFQNTFTFSPEAQGPSFTTTASSPDDEPKMNVEPSIEPNVDYLAYKIVRMLRSTIFWSLNYSRKPLRSFRCNRNSSTWCNRPCQWRRLIWRIGDTGGRKSQLKQIREADNSSFKKQLNI